MTVYAVSNGVLSHSVDNSTWLLDRAAKYERRLERGRVVDEDTRAWLLKPSQLERWALWCELVAFADVDGIAQLDQLAALAWFDTQRRRGYVLTQLEQRGLIERLDSERVRVL